jgi:hypothetical protein
MNKYINLDFVTDKFEDIVLGSTSAIPFISNVDDYNLTVQQYSIPSTLIPIFLMKDRDFRIRYTYGTTTIDFDLIYNILNNSGEYAGKQAIWHYQDLLDILNEALRLGFEAIKLAEPGMDATQPCFVTLDRENDLFVFNSEQNYGNLLKVFFNSNLYNLFGSFESIKQADTYFQILIKDNGNNTTEIFGRPYYSTYQDYQTLKVWSDIKRIVFTTSDIPVASEYTSNTSAGYINIVQDFETEERIFTGEPFVFYPRGEQRWYNLYNNDSISRITVNVLWFDKKNNFYPVRQGPNDYSNIKLRFKNKLSDVISV